MDTQLVTPGELLEMRGNNPHTSGFGSAELRVEIEKAHTPYHQFRKPFMSSSQSLSWITQCRKQAIFHEQRSEEAPWQGTWAY